MLNKITKYELVLTMNDKKQILDNRQELGKKFLGETFHNTINEIANYYSDYGTTEMLDKLSFIPCVKEIKDALITDLVDYSEVEKYIADIVQWLEDMPYESRKKYEFNLSFDYEDFYNHYDGDQDEIRERLVEYNKDILDFILSDDRLEKYGTELRNDFCEWLTSKSLSLKTEQSN